jgi:hypothetical protein
VPSQLHSNILQLQSQSQDCLLTYFQAGAMAWGMMEDVLRLQIRKRIWGFRPESMPFDLNIASTARLVHPLFACGTYSKAWIASCGELTGIYRKSPQSGFAAFSDRIGLVAPTCPKMGDPLQAMGKCGPVQTSGRPIFMVSRWIAP